MEATLLIELLTEELPPKSLQTLADAFAAALFVDLNKSGFVADGGGVSPFATPRRLAMRITRVRERSPDSEREVQGPPVNAAPAAIAGFATKSGVAIEMLEKRDSPKGMIHVARVRSQGSPLEAVLADKVQAALKTLPIAKLMRWGAGEAQFVRPVHGLVMLHGARVVPGEVLGLRSGNRTHGHRFLGARDIVLSSADDYETRLADDGRVIADFAKRRDEIEGLLQAEAKRQGAVLGEHAELLDEVTALVELPTVYVGEFDPAFLAVPQECLILTMRQNQKYFPLFSPDGRLLAKFLIVSNMRIPDARHIVAGNQRVVRPRLEDARFFFDQDRRERLEARVPRLARVVYHNKLGSQLERVERIQLAAGGIARQLNAEPVLAERAAWLAKADLLTGMVGEFPELQGVMGRYYALHDGEPEAVADAIEAHYRPRYAGDRLPEGPVACAVALADKLDTLVGMFAVGGAPTGDKDPYALRRAALGVLRILIELKLPLSLPALLADAAARFANGGVKASVAGEVYAFALDRLRNHLRELGYAADEIEAVASQNPARIDLVPPRLDAVRSFRALPEAESLAAANKRIRNILKKAEGGTDVVDRALLREEAERALFDAVERLAPQVDSSIARLDYGAALKALAGARAAVDRFFDDVLVNAEDARLRANRLALLRRLDQLMNRVADISRLAQ
jgi:glycyl-tRNA synthetase beta chain